MLKKNILSLLFLITLVCSFSSCEEIDPWDDHNQSNPNYLFDRAWEDEFINKFDEDCVQTLEFYRNGRGMEYMEYYSHGKTTYEERPFTWKWDHEYPYSLFIDYVDGDFSYFGKLRITPNRLDGYWNDEPVSFDAVY